MAELILDGYTITSRLKSESWPEGELTVLHRPLPARESRLILEQVKQLPDKKFRPILEQQLRLRLTPGFDVPFESMTLPELQDAIGKFFDSENSIDAINLLRGLPVAIRYPHLANVSCQQCRDWWFDPLDPINPLVRDRTGRPLRRSDPNDVLCETEHGCPKGHWKSPIELSHKNLQAWRHFRGCDAIGRFPDDPMVIHNASIIRDVLRTAERSHGGFKTIRR